MRTLRINALAVLLLGGACAGRRPEKPPQPASARPSRPGAILWEISPNFGRRPEGGRIDAIVIHTTEGGYRQAIEWFKTARSEVSAHFVIGPDGEITQMAALSRRAWHATYYNDRSIGIEVAGHAGRSDTWTPENLEALTALTAWLCVTFDIPVIHPTAVAESKQRPLDVPGIVGHAQVQPWNRRDPGPYFPWSRFVADVRRRVPDR